MDGLSVVGAMLKVAAVFVLFWFSLRALGRMHGQGRVRPGAPARPEVGQIHGRHLDRF